MKKIIVGSQAFFKGMDGFHPHDVDTLIIDDVPSGYVNVRQLHVDGMCEFRWRRMTKEEYIGYALSGKGPGMQIGKFLVPEFADEIGMTIEDLKKLRPLISKLDDKHKYEARIFNAYLANNAFTLTDKQRQEAYEEYRAERREAGAALINQQSIIKGKDK